MTKIIGLLVVLIAIGAGLFYFMRTTTLTVQAVLVADGLDVTDRMSLNVGLVGDGATLEDMSVLDLERLYPVEGTQHTYTVPGGQPVAMLAYHAGLGRQVSDRVTVAQGDTETHRVVLDAGLVEVTVLTDPDLGSTRIKHIATMEGIGPELDPSGVATFIVPAGAQTFEANQEFTTEAATIDVIAGETYEVTLDLRRTDVTLMLDTAIAWTDGMPDVEYQLVGPDGWPNQTRSQDGTEASLRGLVFGDYAAQVEFFQGDGPRYLRPNPVGMIAVTLSEKDSAVALPVPLAIINPDLAGWGLVDLQDVDIMVRGITDVGLAYAAVEAGSDAPLVFLQTNMTARYAIAVARGNDVLAVQEIGEITPNAPLAVSVAQGGDVALCEAVTEVANCDALQP